MMKIENSMSACPLCAENIKLPPAERDYGSKIYIKCGSCGVLGFVNEANITEFQSIVGLHNLRRKPRVISPNPSVPPFLTSEFLDSLSENYPDHNANELLENFISTVCESTNSIGKMWKVRSCELAYFSIARNYDAGEWCFKQLLKMGWISPPRTMLQGRNSFEFTVTSEGWSNFYSLKKQATSSKQAFLAMAFSNEVLRNQVVPHLKAACLASGFELITVDEERRAGSIDDKIRVDIRNSRFLIADISDENPGAYFEAGFAEGLEKPVFYICDKRVFDAHHCRENGKKSIHFDVEHHDIITWDADDLATCQDELLASIRNTLPKEAKMTNLAS